MEKEIKEIKKAMFILTCLIAGSRDMLTDEDMKWLHFEFLKDAYYKSK